MDDGDKPKEALTGKGKPYSAKYTRFGVEMMAERAAARQDAKEQARQRQEAAEQKTAELLHGLPEFSGSSDARIRKVSRELVKSITSIVVEPGTRTR